MIESVKFWIYQFTFWFSALTIAYSMERRENFWKRFSTCMFIQIVISGVGHAIFMRMGPQMEFLVRGISSFLMIVLLYSCWKLTKTMAVYNAIWAIVMWQLIKELWDAIENILPMHVRTDEWMIGVTMALYFGTAFFVCAKTIAAWMPVDRKKWIGPRQMTTAVLIYGLVMALAFSPALRADIIGVDWLLMYMSQTFCLLILFLQNEIFKRSYMREEMDLMKLLMKKEQDQYRMTKENIALINQKCHDMKHQIQAIRSASVEEREAYLSELEETIQIYESMVKTGNEVLDTILTDKSLYCKDRGIKISCVVDGSQMGFIHTIDLYTLLGNAIDNAIEAVEKFSTIEKRQIDVMAYRQQNFLVLNIINPVKIEPVYEESDELPVTIKGDKRYHGFGLPSMKFILEKYEGHLNVKVEDGCFDLKMLIPIPPGKETVKDTF